MARNVERNQALLNRWVGMIDEMKKGGPKMERPKLASECQSLPAAIRFRDEVVGQIRRKISKIQNAGLGEARIRDLNDDINRLFREKWHWDKRVDELGGDRKDSRKRRRGRAEDREAEESMKRDDDPLAKQGLSLAGEGGYMYFGAARELPGVRELFAEQEKDSKKRKRWELNKGLTPDYWGFRDEDDTKMLEEEDQAELQLRGNIPKRKAVDILHGAVAPRKELIPDESAVDAAVTERKRAALLAKLSKMA